MIKCPKCGYQSDKFFFEFTVTGYELNRHGYIGQIYLCNKCLESGLNELEKQLYFKSFNFIEYKHICISHGWNKFLKGIGGQILESLCRDSQRGTVDW